MTGLFRYLALKGEPASPTPIVDRLAGILSPDVSVDEHYAHLIEKYGGISDIGKSSLSDTDRGMR